MLQQNPAQIVVAGQLTLTCLFLPSSDQTRSLPQSWNQIYRQSRVLFFAYLLEHQFSFFLIYCFCAICNILRVFFFSVKPGPLLKKILKVKCFCVLVLYNKCHNILLPGQHLSKILKQLNQSIHIFWTGQDQTMFFAFKEFAPRPSVTSVDPEIMVAHPKLIHLILPSM